jgi:dihydrofolate reductase
MAGGTEFFFVTEGIETALKRAGEAAQGLDVRLGGGVLTVREYLLAGLIDEMQLTVSPVLMGSGENLFSGIDLSALGYHCDESIAGERATHVYLRRGRLR